MGFATARTSVLKKMRRFATVEGQILSENAEIVHFFHTLGEDFISVNAESKRKDVVHPQMS
jgi:hypothetical protein